MKKIILLPLILCAALLCGCHTITLTNFDTGETIIAVSHPFRLISATMPDGEVLKGTYSAIDNSSISTSFGSATAFGGGTSATAFGSGTSYNVGGRGTVYALLKSTKPGSKLMLEIYANFSPMTTHGFGQARTNDGRTYRVTF
jgi:hypothetical protein